ncbi:ribokinase [Parahaliea mediterranea]|uniref:Ribokinase n=1 Tax=Parahaliea mediterranea TaxID=651086 RepID=A0A939DCT3_9GAMM|nr:ribokinase [Parahaliea mediterranea]MBN7795709.1 ribokinase [Parahaliea mediterranea]
MAQLVVIGSSNTDMILQVPHLPGPGETVLGGTFSTAPGGKGANQAVAAARAGADVSLVACVGRDSFGEQALAGFAAEGIDTRHCVVDDDTPSGVAHIFVAADGENAIGVASGANARLGIRHLQSARSLLRKATVLLLQLESPLDTVIEAARMGRAADTVVILNPAPACELPADLYPLLDMITPNESEVEALTGIAVRDAASAAAAAAVLHDRGVNTVLVTRAARGVYLSQRDGHNAARGRLFDAFAVDAVDTTAAGDVFNGCLAAALTRGGGLEAAIRFAQGAAALSVQTLGAQTSAPTRTAIETFVQHAFDPH